MDRNRGMAVSVRMAGLGVRYDRFAGFTPWVYLRSRGTSFAITSYEHDLALQVF